MGEDHGEIFGEGAGIERRGDVSAGEAVMYGCWGRFGCCLLLLAGGEEPGA